MTVSRSWQEYMLDVSIYESIRRFDRNCPLIENLSQIFTQLCETLRQVYNFEHCIHVFLNYSLPEAHLLVPSKNSTYQRQFYQGNSEMYSQLLKMTKRENWLKSETDTPTLITLESSRLIELLGILNFPNVTNLSPENGTLITFDSGKLNLGMFILWGFGSRNKIKAFDRDNFIGRVAALYKTYGEFLDKEYQLLSNEVNRDGELLCKKTYLPSFNSSRWARVAILYVDIHNFTPFTEILRSTKRDIEIDLSGPPRSVLEVILNSYFESMAGIVHKNRGRIERFFGAGVLAVFGEHEEDDYEQASRRAVVTAIEMVKKFRELRSNFYQTGLGEKYQHEFNDVELNLGIGIDYGTVLFDYLGDARHREYSIAGDHVNFARMLGYEAGRYDPVTKEERSGVLISNTMKNCIEGQLTKKDYKNVTIWSQERNYPYMVYGIDEKIQFR